MDNFNILLISEKYVKNFSPLMQNVDSQLIRMHMFEAQNIDFKNLIGDELFNEIIEQFNSYKTYIDGGGSTNPITNYVEQRILDLVDKSKPYMMYRTLLNSAYSLSAKLTNKGITNQSSDYSDTADMVIVEKMRGDWKHKSNNYGQLIIDFLKDNASDYPEYINDCDSSSGGAFKSGFYLGKNI